MKINFRIFRISGFLLVIFVLAQIEKMSSLSGLWVAYYLLGSFIIFDLIRYFQERGKIK